MIPQGATNAFLFANYEILKYGREKGKLIHTDLHNLTGAPAVYCT